MDITGTPTTPSPTTREQFEPVAAPIGLPWRLALAGVVAFLLSFFIYFGIKFGYLTFLEKQEARANADLEHLAETISSQEQEQFVVLYSQIINLKKVLDEHRFSSGMFPFLEQNVVQGIVFSGAEFTMANRTLRLDGIAENLASLALQVNEFSKSPEVSEVTLEKVGVSGGAATFTFSILFKSSALVRPASGI
jgi:hypothetical protein